MSDQMNDLLAEAQTLATQDQTVTPVGYEKIIAPAGKTMARFVSYIEIGKQKQRNSQEGKPVPPTSSAILQWELNSKKHIRVDDAGVAHSNIHTETTTIKLGDKGNFKKLFNKMRNGRDSIKNMAHMLSDSYLIDLVHNESEKDGKKATYVNMRSDDGSWLIGPPMVEDAVSGEVTHVPVPPATVQLRLLLWDNPTERQWDSIFIDGTYTKTVDGVEKEFSKNWIQERCIKAADFEGSALQAMLMAKGGVNFDLPVEEDAVQESENPDPTAEPVKELVKEQKQEPAPEVKKESVKEADNAADILASMGL